MLAATRSYRSTCGSTSPRCPRLAARCAEPSPAKRSPSGSTAPSASMPGHSASHPSVRRPGCVGIWIRADSSPDRIGSGGKSSKGGATQSPALEQGAYRLSLAVVRHVDRPLLHDVGRGGWNAQRVIDGGVEILDWHGVLDGRARSLVGGSAVDKPFLDAATEQHHGPGRGEVPVHAVVFRR